MKPLSRLTPVRTILCIIITSFVCSQSNAAASSNRNQNYIGANFEIQPNKITHLKLPIKALKGSHLSTSDSLTIRFKDKGSITIHTITNESLGLSVDLRAYPKHVMGLEKTNQKNEYAHLINTQIKDSVTIYQPLKTALFKTRNGDGFLTIGLKNSVIYLTDNQADNVITKIHIEDMSEHDINSLIIKGLL